MDALHNSQNRRGWIDVCVISFLTDAALLAEAGIPAVLFGVDGAGAHAASEWVDLDSLRAATRALERAVSAWSG